MEQSLPEPEWVTVPINPRYQVTRCGRVRRLGYWRNRVRKATGEVMHCWYKQNEVSMIVGKRGYYCFAVTDEIGTKTIGTVHRFVASAFIPNPKGLKEVNHIDGNKLNNALSNLEWVTHAQNLAHASRIGLSPHGDRATGAKFTNDDALDVRACFFYGARIVDLCEAYGVRRQTIYDIVHRIRYRFA